VAEQCRHPRTVRICSNDEEWMAALEEALSRTDADDKSVSARDVVREHYSTGVVAARHLQELREVMSS